MNEDIKDTIIFCEKEKEIMLDKSFRWILRIAIGLTGLLSFVGLYYIGYGILEKTWNIVGITFFCNQLLFYVSIQICFVALISIAVVKRPFSRILTGCIMTIGIIVITSSIVFPRFTGYVTSGFHIMSSGSFTLIDGLLLILGLLFVIFAKLIQYGFRYQNNSDMTI